jgi:hypothetical protein
MCRSLKARSPIIAVKAGYAIYFAATAGFLLGVTGVGKVWSACGVSLALDAPDPVFGLQSRWLVLGVGVAEIVVSSLCVFNGTGRTAAIATAWLASSFVVYRVGLLLVGYQGLCPCLGKIADALPFSPGEVEMATKVALGYLVAWSYCSLLWHRVPEAARRVTAGAHGDMAYARLGSRPECDRNSVRAVSQVRSLDE